MLTFLVLILALVVTLSVVSECVLRRDPVRASSQLRRRLRSSPRSRR